MGRHHIGHRFEVVQEKKRAAIDAARVDASNYLCFSERLRQ